MSGFFDCDIEDLELLGGVLEDALYSCNSDGVFVSPDEYVRLSSLYECVNKILILRGECDG